jgi:hypothetical protein
MTGLQGAPASQDYPSREQLALDLIKEPQAGHPLLGIRAITADSADCTPRSHEGYITNTPHRTLEEGIRQPD